MRWMWVAAVAAGGCVLPINEGPTVRDADVSCGYDDRAFDWVWTASATIDDLNGDGDVWRVEAYLYDVTFGRELEQVLELDDAGDGLWETERLEGGTNLWCAGGRYEVEVVATDALGAQGRRTFVMDLD